MPECDYSDAEQRTKAQPKPREAGSPARPVWSGFSSVVIRIALCTSLLISSMSWTSCVTKPINTVIEPCPYFSEGMRNDWKFLYQFAGLDFKLWMGDIILYCTDQQIRFEESG